MIAREFDYHAPTSVADAFGVLKQYGDDAKLLAGGHSLLRAWGMGRGARGREEGVVPARSYGPRR